MFIVFYCLMLYSVSCLGLFVKGFGRVNYSSNIIFRLDFQSDTGTFHNKNTLEHLYLEVFEANSSNDETQKSTIFSFYISPKNLIKCTFYSLFVTLIYSFFKIQLCLLAHSVTLFVIFISIVTTYPQNCQITKLGNNFI